MEIRYIRKLTASCMRLAEMEELSEWEKKMIAHAPAGRILFAESVWEDGQRELWYDITGKQSLGTILDSEMLGYELLRHLLVGIYEALERLESILLRADALLLTSETIFWDYRAEEFFFCYYPGNPTAAQAAFADLMEELLIKLAHDDERAVDLAYRVYERTTGGRINIKELKELLGVNGRNEVQEEPKPDTNTERGEDHVRSGAEDEADAEKCVAQREGMSGVFHLPGRWMDWLKALRERLRWPLSRQKRDEGEMEGFVFEPEPEEKKVPVRPTVLLTELTHPPEGILRYEGKGSSGDMVIDRLPYTIGSGEACDGYLPSATVSRRHAQITQKEGIYFIEDLNSANGTYVDGRLLDYRTRVSLQKNEIIVFADEKYRFI